MFVQRQRARLHGEQEAIFSQQQELEGRLAVINRELRAIDAYEAAKSGKTVAAPKARGRRLNGRCGKEPAATVCWR
jgi:hypothetical protein